LCFFSSHSSRSAYFLQHSRLEQTADVVMFIYRDDIYNPETERRNQADIVVAKHRNGPIGEVALYFERSQTRFRDIDGPSGSFNSLEEEDIEEDE
jgi:replicative DNA helicase